MHESNEREGFSLFLVGNKSDLSDQRAVPQNYGQNKCKEIPECVMFKETSAFNDVESILALFNEIGIAIIKKKHASKNRNSHKLDH